MPSLAWPCLSWSSSAPANAPDCPCPVTSQGPHCVVAPVAGLRRCTAGGPHEQSNRHKEVARKFAFELASTGERVKLPPSAPGSPPHPRRLHADECACNK